MPYDPDTLEAARRVGTDAGCASAATRGRRVWGARGQFSERDADAYAIRMLRAWRRRDA